MGSGPGVVGGVHGGSGVPGHSGKKWYGPSPSLPTRVRGVWVGTRPEISRQTFVNAETGELVVSSSFLSVGVGSPPLPLTFPPSSDHPEPLYLCVRLPRGCRRDSSEARTGRKGLLASALTPDRSGPSHVVSPQPSRRRPGSRGTGGLVGYLFSYCSGR